MSEKGRAPHPQGTTEMARVLLHCYQQLQASAPRGTAPLLRFTRGAGLIRGARAQRVLELLEPLLALAAPCLYVPPAQSTIAGVTIRPKLRVTLQLGGAGLLAQLRYFGKAPADADLRRLYAAPSSATQDAIRPACALPAVNKDGFIVDSPQQFSKLPAAVSALANAATHDPGVPSGTFARDEICLRAVWHEPARRWPLVRVMAGRREIAIPMFSIEQVMSGDTISGDLPPTRSLAKCLHEESSPSSLGRPALLMLRRHGPRLALQVEALLGHGDEVVHPVGPLLQSTPWVLGVIGNGDTVAPTLVVDPLALPGLISESARAAM